MANYFEIQNNDNVVAIDDSYRNLSFVRKYQGFNSITINNISSVTPSNSNFYRLNRGSGVVSLPRNNNSIFAVRCTNPNILFIGENKQAFTDIRFTMNTDEEINSVLSAITIYEFQDVAIPPTNIGIEVRNENGTIVYSTTQKMLKVIDFSLEYREGINAKTDNKAAVYYNKNIAIVMGSPLYVVIPNERGVFSAFEMAYMPTQNSYAMKWAVSGPTPATGNFISGSRNILVVDITGL